jgi:hypothetical protein
VLTSRIKMHTEPMRRMSMNGRTIMDTSKANDNGKGNKQGHGHKPHISKTNMETRTSITSMEGHCTQASIGT